MFAEFQAGVRFQEYNEVQAFIHHSPWEYES